MLETFGCSQSYIEAQKQFFQRRQRDGESLREFSYSLMALMDAVKRKNPTTIPDSDQIVRDHFAEHVRDGMLRRELKRLIRQQASISFIDIRGEAIRWADDGERGSVVRARAYSCDTHGDVKEVEASTSRVVVESRREISDLKETLRKQQVQLDTILQCLSTPVWRAPPSGQSNRPQRYQFDAEERPICMRCGQSGHIARRCNSTGGVQQATLLVGATLGGVQTMGKIVMGYMETSFI